MEEQATGILGFTPSALWVTVGVLVALGVIVKLVFDLIIGMRELKRPKMSDEKSIRDKLKSDHERLTSLETTTKRQDEELKLILRSQMDIIHHMIDGNGVERLKETQRDIEAYLITGKIGKREEN